ncbi:MAG: hypothetical protein B6U73_03125 [Desulfurococcales archaeon ex4484_204]|nr:MAG: hypothetical protein B6U73_03125 [Desulfurococcales archaeon ex4484_204]
MLRVTFIGVGGWVTNPSFGHISILVEGGSSKVLLDFGEGSYWGYVRCVGREPWDVDYLILTHRHGDHILGVPTLAQMARARGRVVRIASIPDAVGAVKDLLRAVGARHCLENLDFTELSLGSEASLGGVRVKAIPAKHSVTASSIIMKISSYVVAYSGDTLPNPSFLSEARGADVLIHEVSAPRELAEEARAYGHTSEVDVEYVVSYVKPRYFIPIHYSEYLPRLPAVPGTELVAPSPCGRVVIK